MNPDHPPFPPARVWAALILGLTAGTWAHDENVGSGPKPADVPTKSGIVQSRPGDNAWNAGQPAQDWWAEIQRQHGHVGPWNVLGWRIGQAALREFKTPWGRHELEVICYVPPQTPFTCLVDGPSVGTGNSLGRLDLRLAEIFSYPQSFVAVRRKDLKGDVLEFRPEVAYLKSIADQPVDKLEGLSRQCLEKPERELFTIRRISP
jgi:formylmethanofuran dehydrogenase subunit E